MLINWEVLNPLLAMVLTKLAGNVLQIISCQIWTLRASFERKTTISYQLSKFHGLLIHGSSYKPLMAEVFQGYERRVLLHDPRRSHPRARPHVGPGPHRQRDHVSRLRRRRQVFHADVGVGDVNVDERREAEAAATFGKLLQVCPKGTHTGRR